MWTTTIVEGAYKLLCAQSDVSVFIPMTFPTETISFRDTRATLYTSVRDSMADTGEFYGLMTVAAAHKGAVNGPSLGIDTPSPNNYQVVFDSNYCVMKGKCLRVLNNKLRDPSQALDHIAIQTVIHLITSSVSGRPPSSSILVFSPY